ncbi:MAG TPA: TraB/GumN family protein [Stenotrophomonas sp.]|nr:TraB/GumN family protein [Stenotrophomonas sp.]
MKRCFSRGLSLLLVLAGLLLAGPALAASASAPPVPLLWKVTGHQGATVYLLGSFHLLRADDYPLAPEVDAAFARASRVMFELPADQVQSPELAAQMLQAATRSDGRSLREDLTPAQWTALQAYAAQHGLSLQTLSGYDAWFVALTLSLSEMAVQGLDPSLGLDQHFMREAGKAGKASAGLETAAEQIALLDGMSQEEQRQMLAEALDDARDGNRQSRELHDAWRRGDAAKMWSEMALDMKREYPALYRNINVARNDRWVPKLEARLQAGQGTTLVVVGTLHLLGADGVVEKLRARGYQVERICAVCAK